MPRNELVLLPLPFDHCFTYVNTFEGPQSDGNIVEVSFGNKNPKSYLGMIWNAHGRGNNIPQYNKKLTTDKIKPIKSITNLCRIPEVLQCFMSFVSEYNIIPIGSVLKMILNIRPRDLLYQSHQDKLEHKEHIAPYYIPQATPLNLEQQKVANTILTQYMHSYNVCVIDGVAGAGKTEVYLHIARYVLNNGGQVLIIAPEIVLATQLTDRFKQRLGINTIAEWHSRIGPAKKRSTWFSIQNGTVNFIVGARSALFLPYRNLKLIIIDEEQDTSLKQEESAIYNARDMSVARAKFENIPIILSSATPSIETIHNIRLGKYHSFDLKQTYFSHALPTIKIVDMNEIRHTQQTNTVRLDKTHISNFPKACIHDITRKHLIECFDNGNQSMIFLNKRGYAPIAFCIKCQTKMQCPNCQFWLVYHSYSKTLECHHCGYKVEYTKQCTICGEINSMRLYGIGIERVEEEVKHILPKARILLLASDTIDSQKTAKQAINAITNKEIDIMIGTQIIAKGLHFSDLLLVVALDANPSYLGTDIRTMEKTYQLLYQTIGRAGREKEGAKVLLQTYEPHNTLLQNLAARNRDAFIEEELRQRKIAGSPPFSRVVIITCSSKNEERLEKYMQYMASSMPHIQTKAQIFGPMPSPLRFLKGKYRYRFIIKSEKKFNIQKIIRDWLNNMHKSYHVKIKVDVDPYRFD